MLVSLSLNQTGLLSGQRLCLRAQPSGGSVAITELTDEGFSRSLDYFQPHLLPTAHSALPGPYPFPVASLLLAIYLLG